MALDNELESTIQLTEEQLAAQAKQEQDANLAAVAEKEELDQLNNYQVALVGLNMLTQFWKTEEARTNANRLLRDIDISVESLRDAGEIDQDETFIPVRVIDGNIIREIPPFINFLKSSNRIAIFKDPLDPSFDTGLLEAAFTQGMTYPSWIKPFYKVVDGSATHGWASVEVVYDETKPLKCGIEYVAHEDLIFYVDAKDLNTLSCVVRRYKVTSLQLKSWVANFGFDQAQVTHLLEQLKNSTEKDKTIEVYKRYSKYKGQVYSAWFSNLGNCTDWLKKPELHYCGIDEQYTEMVDMPQMVNVPLNLGGVQDRDQDGDTTKDLDNDGDGAITNPLNPTTPLTIPSLQMVPTPVQKWRPKPLQSYPFFVLPYRETEKPLLFDYIGRVFLDRSKQEAQTSITTSFVNGLSRSMQIYGSPKADSVQDGRQAKQLPIALSNGTILDKPFEFWSTPAPDPVVLKALEYMDTANAADTGQTAFAVNNRPDSRKTATEIKSAEKDSDLLSSVDLTLFSEFIRGVMNLCWLICQSQALQNRIKFLLVKPPTPNDSAINILGNIQSEQQAVNDVDTIARTYDVRAAGDVDVIAKEDILNKMQSDWPVIANTPLASRFLADYMKLKYPQDGGLYAEILLNGDPKIQIIQALGTALQGMVNDPAIASQLSPQDLNNLKQLENETAQVLQPQGAGQVSSVSKQPKALK